MVCQSSLANTRKSKISNPYTNAASIIDTNTCTSGSQIPAAVLNPGKQKLAAGLLSGSFGAAITLEKVLTEVDLQPDLAVVTTGEDDQFPSDLLIGWIGKTGAKEASSVYQKAEVVPAVNPSELKTVFIIK